MVLSNGIAAYVGSVAGTDMGLTGLISSSSTVAGLGVTGSFSLMVTLILSFSLALAAR